MEEPMYKEIPQHLYASEELTKEEKKRKQERIAWQQAHKTWWSL